MAENYQQAERDHAEAMRHANDGFTYRHLGAEDEARTAFRRAWELERRAAMSLIDGELEPSRSVLFCSAASLALLCGEHRDARMLAHCGLGGSPTKRVRESLEIIVADADAYLADAHLAAAHMAAARHPSVMLRVELHQFPSARALPEPPFSLWEQVA
jgi:hypothetical protein